MPSVMSYFVVAAMCGMCLGQDTRPNDVTDELRSALRAEGLRVQWFDDGWVPLHLHQVRDELDARWVIQTITAGLLGGSAPVSEFTDDRLERACRAVRGTNCAGVELEGCTKVTEKGLNGVVTLANLRYVSIGGRLMERGPAVTDDWLKVNLHRIGSLEVLRAQGAGHEWNAFFRWVGRAGSGGISGIGLGGLSRLAKLRIVDVSHCSHLWEGFVGFGPSAIEALSVADTRMTNEHVGWIVACHRVRKLDVSWNAIDDAALDALSVLREVEDLRIGGCRVTDEGLKVLARFPKLAAVDLGIGEFLTYRSRITEEGVRALCEALPECWVTWNHVRRRGSVPEARGDGSETRDR